MSLNWTMRKERSGKLENTGNITSDFTCVKVSALNKVSLLSEFDHTIIRPQSLLYCGKLENRENEQNSCNIKSQQNISPKSNTISTTNGIVFSVKKIIQESELQRKEAVWKKINRRIEHMKENDRIIQEQMENSLCSLARERERRSAEELAQILAKEEQIAKEEELNRKREQELHAQSIQEQNEKFQREMEEYRRKMEEKQELMKAVIVHRNQCIASYHNIMTLCKCYKNKQALNVILTTNALKIKELYHQLEVIDEKLESEELVPSDLNIAEDLTCRMNDILNIFRIEIEKIEALSKTELSPKAENKDEGQPGIPVTEITDTQTKVGVPHESNGNHMENEENIKQNPSLIANQEKEIVNVPMVIPVSDLKAEEIKQEETSNNHVESQEGNLFAYVDKESLQIYIRSEQFLANYRHGYEEFLSSDNTKQFRFECRKAINIPVNAISMINEQHLRDKYDRLQNLLTGKSSFNVMQHPQGMIFCKDHLAVKLVSQGDTLVSSKPEMAFPIAAIIVALWNEHADLGELFLAHFHKLCPFTVPIFMPQQKGQSNEDYYRSLGCKYSEDGTVEKQDKFLKRMSGLMRLYASITITRQRRGVMKNHPHGLQHAWRWLAVVLNTAPRADTSDLCATLLLDMLEVTGYYLSNAYPKQFPKLLRLLMEHYYPFMRNVAATCGGPLSRLEEFLNNALTKGTVCPAKGLLPPNFW